MTMSIRAPLALFLVASCAALSPHAHADYLAYDNARFQNGNFVAGQSAISGNAWVGQSLTLMPSTPSLSITGIDAPVACIGSEPGPAGGAWRLRVRIYDSYSSSGTPVFGNLVSEQFVVAASGGLAPGFIHALPSSTPNTPFWMFASPVTVSTLGPIGVSYIFESFDGTAWASSTTLQTVAFANNTGPLVGSTNMPGGKGYYQRSSSALPSMPGNFEAANQLNISGWSFNGLDLRVWTAVPTPGSLALVAFSGVIVARRRRD